MVGGLCPPLLYPKYASLFFHLIFFVGKAVKIFLPHLQDFLVAAVPNSWEKPGVFSSPRVARAPPSPWEGGRAGASPAPGSRKACRSSERKRPSQVGASNPPWGSSALFCWWRCCGSRLQREKMGNLVTGEDNYSEALLELNWELQKGGQTGFR